MSSFLSTLKYALVLFTLAFFFLAGNAYAQTTCSSHMPSDPPTEKDALIALYCATGGVNWKRKDKWLSDSPLNEWSGVTVSNSQVTQLNIFENNLSGTIPTELGVLTSLQRFILGQNSLSGAIPSELGNLTKLERLYLDQNSLSGAIPSELGNLSDLTQLLLHQNSLSGAIPSELGNLSDLTQLHLYQNSLSGAIPSELGNLSNLEWLYLNQNSLSGAIPSELGNLSDLTQLYLNQNSLSGAIPSELGNLSNLERLYLYGDQLTGTIPSELGNLTKLKHMFLHQNKLTGTIPSELGDLTSLEQLYLRENQLSGSIPTELGDLTNLKRLYLYENSLSGSIPTELGDLTKLQRLFLQDTMLTGGTALIGEMETLTDASSFVGLGLWGNDDLAGAARQASNDLGKRIDWAALWAIYVGNGGSSWKNRSGWFSGQFGFSSWYGVQANSDGRVEILDLRHNDLKEDVVSAFEAIKDLKRLDLSYNGMLTGELSPRLIGLSSLTELNIRCTQVTKPTDTGFTEWLQTIIFIEAQEGDACSVLPPLPVRMVTVTPGVRRLSVSWEESADADGYKVQWKSGMEQFNETNRQAAITGRNNTSYEITGLNEDAEYTVRVIATKSNADKGLARVEVAGIPRAPAPARVTGVSLTPGPKQLQVSWTEVTNADGYKVEWKGEFDAHYFQHSVSGGDTTSHTITGLTAGNDYTVRVVATRSNADDGQPSQEVTGIPRAPTPGQVTGVSVTPGVERLIVSWTAVDIATGYKIQWKSGGQQFNETNQFSQSSVTTNYVIRLIGGREYTVRVIATRYNADDGQPSQEVTGIPRARAPGQVTGVSVTPGVERLSLSWTKVRDAGGYKIQWKSGGQQFNDTDRQRTVTGGNTTSHAITGLDAGTQYTVRVIATRAHADDGSPSVEIEAVPKNQPPARVTGVNVTPGIERLSVSWDTLAGADGYKVQWKSGSQSFASDRQSSITNGSTTSYAITGLDAGTQYTVRVIATKSNADDGQPSQEVAGTPMAPTPGQVTGVRVTPGVERLSVSWNALGDADGYKVQWKSGNQSFSSNRQSSITGGSTTSYVITGLNAGTLYTVRVIATRSNANDSLAEIEVTGTPKAPTPGQVTGVRVTPGVGRLSVSWNALADADGYKVQWKSSSQQFNDTDRQRMVTGGSTTSYVITGLDAGTLYTVRVIASRAYADDGQPSSEVTGTLRAPAPAQVTGISVTPGVRSLSVSWNEVTDANGYKVQWKSDNQEFDTDRQAIITGGSTTSYVITGLNAGTLYTVRVIATRINADDSPPSSEEAFGAPRAAPVSPPTTTPTPTSGQVTGVRVTPGIQSLSVSWNEVADANGYKIQWKSGSQEFDPGREDTVTGMGTTSHVITGLDAGTQYTVRVIATRLDADDEQPSQEVAGTPRAPTSGQVTGVRVTPGIQSLSVSWNEVADADGYKIQWKSGSQEFDPGREDTVTGMGTTSHVITGLDAGTQYTVRVIATRLDADYGQPSLDVRGIPESSDGVIPVDRETGGGCSIISQKAVENMSARTFFNLLLIVSLIFLPARKISSKNFP